MIKIILLDIDGVLVQPGGYRAALRATVDHFVEPKLDIPEETLTDLERRGIFSEWDMAPLLVASCWTEILARQPIQNLPADVSSAAIEINRRRKVDAPSNLSVPEFSLTQGQYPAETALRAGCFTSIPYDLRKNLLTETRAIDKSQTMRIFQHFTLGSKKFTETYELPPEFETESFLLTYDRPNITGEIRAQLFQSNHRLAILTSRPSRPPCEVGGFIAGFAPEAELALELVGLSGIPSVAFGKLQYLASQYGLDPATLLKPSPIQALAAVFAAWMEEEWPALQAANQWRETGKLNGLSNQLPKAFELIVIEDTMSGIRSVLATGEILQKAGINVIVRPFGLTSGSAAKSSAFKRAGIPCYEDWGTLIAEIGE